VVSLVLHGAALVATGHARFVLPTVEPTEDFVAGVQISFASTASVAVEAPPAPPPATSPVEPTNADASIDREVAITPLPRDTGWLDASAGRQVDGPERPRDLAALLRRFPPRTVNEPAASTDVPPTEPTTEPRRELASAASIDAVEVLAPLPGGNPAPEYPDSARRRGIEGTVVVRCVVAADGAVDTAAVVASSGSVALDGAAVTAARRWRFCRGGVVDVPFVFQLRDRA